MTNEQPVTGRQIARGAGWMVFLRWAVGGLGFVRTLVLARLLAPTDFGIVALAMMILGFVEALSRLRPDLALIQNTRAERRHYDTVWTLTFLRGLLMALVLVFLARPCASFFGSPELEAIVYWLAAIVLIEGTQNVGAIDFFKDLTFDKVFKLNFASRLGSFLIAVAVALLWQNYWALIAGYATSRILLVALSYHMHAFRPRFSLAAWRDIFDYSKWLIPHGIVFSLRQRADALIIGKLSGASALGFYDLAKTISQFVGAELAAPLRSAMFPAYARMANQPELLKTSFIQSFSLIFCIGAPIAILTGLVARPFVIVVLGNTWLDTIPLIRVLVLYALFHLCNASCGAVFLALGKTRSMLVVQSIGAAVAVPLIYVGAVTASTYGVALAVAFSSAVTTLLSLAYVLYYVNASASEIIPSFLRGCVALIMMASLVIGVRLLIPSDSTLVQNLVQLLVCGIVGGGTYVLALLLLWYISGLPEGPEKAFVSVFRSSTAVLRP